jgi:hypothetical protein
MGVSTLYKHFLLHAFYRLLQPGTAPGGMKTRGALTGAKPGRRHPVMQKTCQS